MPSFGSINYFLWVPLALMAKNNGIWLNLAHVVCASLYCLRWLKMAVWLHMALNCFRWLLKVFMATFGSRCLYIALNDPYVYMWLKMSQDCPRQLKMTIWLHMAQWNPLWFKMAIDCPRWLMMAIWLHMAPDCFIWLVNAPMATYGSKLPKMAQGGFIWLNVEQDGSRLPQMVQHCPR